MSNLCYPNLKPLATSIKDVKTRFLHIKKVSMDYGLQSMPSLHQVNLPLYLTLIWHMDFVSFLQYLNLLWQ
jgi:hypothetical protein